MSKREKIKEFLVELKQEKSEWTISEYIDRVRQKFKLMSSEKYLIEGYVMNLAKMGDLKVEGDMLTIGEDI